MFEHVPHRVPPGVSGTAPGAVGETVGTQVEADPRSLQLDEWRGAIVLLSGGLDSATVLAIARAEGRDCFALTVDYGQRHQAELEAARAVAAGMGAAAHRIVEIDLRAFGGSALTDDIPVPRPRSAEEIGGEIPVTYVPARNTILLSLALAWAEVVGVRDLYIGVNVRDFSGYPDCRPEFLETFEILANLATRAGIESGRPFRVRAPLVNMTKSEIIRRGAELGVPFHLTHSCYDPAADGSACGLCDACILRRQGFKEAGIDDPTRYASS